MQKINSLLIWGKQVLVDNSKTKREKRPHMANVHDEHVSLYAYLGKNIRWTFTERLLNII